MKRLRLWLPLSIVTVVVLMGVVGPLLTDYDALAVNVADRLLPPGSNTSSGELALLGTDQLGRDLLAQIIQGARVSILIGLATLLLAGTIGGVVGVAAGFRGGALDMGFMRLADIQLAFPALLLAIFLASFLGQSVMNVIITLAITRWVVFARVARSQVLTVRRREFVEATSALGGSAWFVIRRCILPSVVSPLAVVATVELGLVIIAEASLSFLGLGTPPTSPSWGLTIANGRDYLDSAWWIAAFPGIALAALVIAVGALGDHLRDWLDPYVRAQATV